MNQIKPLTFEPLFFSPFMVFEVSHADQLNKTLMIDIQKIKATDIGLARSNFGGWHSQDDLFNRPEQSFRQLCLHLSEAIAAATTRVSPNFDFANYAVQAQGWVNILGKSGMNKPHDHAGWSWSGVYYVKIPDNKNSASGCVEFLDSRTNITGLGIEGANCFSNKFTFKPKSGLIIIFPSYLNHWVYPNDSEEERISVAFNARFVKQTR